MVNEGREVGRGRRVARAVVAVAVVAGSLVPGAVASASDLVVDVDVPDQVAPGEPVPVSVAVSGRAAAGSQRVSVEIYRETAPDSGVFSGPIAGSRVLDTPRTGPLPRTVGFDYLAADDESDDVVVACVAPSARLGANTVETLCRVGDGRTVRPVPRSFAGTSPRVGVSPHDVAVVEAAPQEVAFYALATSDDPGGPVYDFVDIAATGTRLSISDTDDESQRVTVPFPITFYDVITDQLEIGTNGGIQVGPNGGYTWLSNRPLPTDTFTTPSLFPMWDDLNPGSNGAIYVATLGTAPNRRFVVQYDDVARFGAGPNGATFQVILFEDRRDVVFQYDDVVFGDARYDFGASATVGVNRDATEATQFSFDTPALRDGLALRFRPT